MDKATWFFTVTLLVNIAGLIFKRPIEIFWDNRAKREKIERPKETSRMKTIGHIFLAFVLPALVVLDLIVLEPLTRLVLAQILVMSFILFSHVTLAVIEKNREWVQDWIVQHQELHAVQSATLLKFMQATKEVEQDKTESSAGRLEAFRRLADLSSEMRQKLEGQAGDAYEDGVGHS
jgi:hypothetical protein